jgi:hypothetical protein
MSNVSDTNETVAARLLFPLAGIICMGAHKLLFPSIFTCRSDRPELGASRPGSIGERKLRRGRSTSFSARNA